MTESRSLCGTLDSLRACCWDITSCSRDEILAIEQLVARHGTEAAVVRSCQRAEVYHRRDCACDAPRKLRGIEALRHLAEVAAGLHSVVLGEAEVLGQVRTAMANAPAWLRPLADVAIAAARELRDETAFHSHSGHLLDRALRIAGVPAAGPAMILGVGQMGRLVAARARELGFAPVIVASRRRPEGHWFDRHELEYWPLARLREAPPVDVLIGCLGSAAEPLLPEDDLPAVRRLIVDLGTPRNFAGPASVQVLAIRDLLSPGEPQEHGAGRRAALRARLAELLERRLVMAAEDGRSHVGALRAEIERRRQAELERIRRLHPEIPPETLDRITKSLINRLFHRPSERLRALPPELAREVVKLFEAGDEP